MGEVVNIRQKQAEYIRQEIADVFEELNGFMLELLDQGADNTDITVAVAMVAIATRRQLTPSEWERITKLATELLAELDAKENTSEDEL